MTTETRPTLVGERRWSSEISLDEPKSMSKMSRSVPSEASPLTKRFRLFKRKSIINTGRRRSVSADNIPPSLPSSSIEPLLQPRKDCQNLKLRITIEEARGLPADADTYAIVRCLNHRSRTHVAKKTSQPNWSCSFDMPLLGARRQKTKRRQWKQGVVITVCSKDRFRSQFLGQTQLCFTEQAILYHDINNRASSMVHNALEPKKSLSQNYQEEEADEGDMTIEEQKRNKGVEQPLLSNEAINEKWQSVSKYHLAYKQPRSSLTSAPVLKSSTSLPPGVEHGPDRFYRKKFTSRSRQRLSSSSSSEKKSKRKLVKRKKKRGIEGKFHQDVVGVTFLEICHAKDLPPEKNLARTGFDMDPFVVVSFGKSTFRTSAVRHNLNPVWNEKLFFHVRHNEANYHLKFTVYDREKFSGNGLVAWCQIPICDIFNQPETKLNHESDLIEQDMGLYTFPLQMARPDKWKDKHPSLTIRAKFMPYSQIRKMFWISLAKSYDAENSGTLSRLEVQSLLETMGSTITGATIDKFWIQHNKDPNNEQDQLTLDELVESLENHMMDTEENNESDESGRRLSLNDASDTEKETGVSYKPLRSQQEDEEDEDDEDDEDDEEDEDEDDDEDEDYDEDWADDNLREEDEEDDEILANLDTPLTTDEDDTPHLGVLGMNKEIDLAEALVAEEDQLVKKMPLHLPLEMQMTATTPAATAAASIWSEQSPRISGKRRPRTVEKVIRLKECPICHRPNLARRSQMDIITHVATCAANDWTTVDRFLMGNFITEAYAQRRWFVKLVRKVGYGKYSLGKDNANILVQDRKTGHLIEEKMSVYIRLGMRLVYKGMRTGIQSRGAQRILTNLTVKQGKRFDDPKSAREIPSFIKFHKISLDEVAEPLSSFKTFNEFFYRKLKPGSRLPDSPEDPTVAVSPADSRMTAFETVSEATRLWIKGVDFSLKKLLGDSQSAQDFEGGSIAVFRLAPQDYHRFHSPVDGTIVKTRHISGQYYTVNPMAIRTTIDVFGENARTVVWIDSEEFGKVAVVCVGAMLVGSIIITANVGSHIKRTDEMGYFAFGGSTLVVVFQKDKMHFDHDLLDNSDKAVETLVRVGNHIGALPC
ncbi:Phosphatidylserine decarboxylase proenzyme 3 [Choanephora cucurbitarum]|uniref:Phosphatidylserine decarboxylase proenzyme 2 n=1 Tax=Choanephora cucurbitarum TaxID=101091 RepID=A0A1C7N5L1_9FUNG|nr:Phosphatidylserine decarboxylase proenzyme 3 [Choanephora cucurbitarum]